MEGDGDQQALQWFSLAGGRYFVREVGDGASLLLGPGQTAAALSPTGTDIARALLGSTGDDDLRAHLARSYQRVPRDRVANAIGEVRGLIAAMGDGLGRYDHIDLDEAASPVFRGELEAPLAADLDVATSDDSAGDGDTADRLCQYIDAVAAATVPFQTLVLRPARPAAGLVAAIEQLAGLGLSAGVRGRASDVTGAALDALAAAVPSRLEVYFAEAIEDTHDRYFGAGDRERAVDVIAGCTELGIECTALVPLTERTLHLLEDTADDLAAMGCRSAATFALVAVESSDGDALAPEQLRQAAALVEELDRRDGEAWSWLPPLRRAPGLSLGYQARRGPRTVRPGAVRISADGTVVAGCGRGRAAGRLLEQPWDDIWSSAALGPLREPRASGPAPACLACPFVRACEGGCVADPGGFVAAEAGNGEEAA